MIRLSGSPNAINYPANSLLNELNIHRVSQIFRWCYSICQYVCLSHVQQTRATCKKSCCNVQMYRQPPVGLVEQQHLQKVLRVSQRNIYMCAQYARSFTNLSYARHTISTQSSVLQSCGLYAVANGQLLHLSRLHSRCVQ